MRKTSFVPRFDLIVYGFSSAEANRIMHALRNPVFERGEILRRLRSLERGRMLPDGFTTSLSKGEVRRLVLCLPSVLYERPRRPAPALSRLGEEEKLDMDHKARMMMQAASIASERLKLLRAIGREWQENPGRLLKHEVGIECC
jgi:hypothetical protein